MWKYSAALLAVSIAVGSVHAAEIAPTDVSFDDGEVANSLTGKAGDPAAGREWYAGRKLGNCLACHQTSDLNNLPFHGEVGPPMDGVADRYETAVGLETREILKVSIHSLCQWGGSAFLLVRVHDER